MVFRLTGKNGDVEDLLGVAAPGFLVANLAVGSSDDFIGGRIEFPRGMQLVADAAFFAWLQSTPGMLAPWLATTCMVIYWIFLSLAVVFFLVSTLCLLQAIKEVEWDTK